MGALTDNRADVDRTKLDRGIRLEFVLSDSQKHRGVSSCPWKESHQTSALPHFVAGPRHRLVRGIGPGEVPR